MFLKSCCLCSVLRPRRSCLVLQKHRINPGDSTFKAAKETLYFASDDEFFVRRNDHDLDSRRFRADNRLLRSNCLVLFYIQLDSESIKVGTNGLPEIRPVFAYPSRKHQGIG